jgi:DNA mismatch repair protein MutL
MIITPIYLMNIKLLSEELINKISAGEVIERPSSVIKELLENSLDAQATKIEIRIENYGQSLIEIKDNGLGMDKENALKSILRHATSKINQEDDLYNISTLGFRGEALASIAAVSKLQLITKQENSLEGFKLEIDAGKIVNQTIFGSEQGTSIKVKDLFYNTPARKKFLKTDSVELKHILDVVTRYALINQNVSFKLYHNNNLLINSPITNNWLDKIISIYGLEISKELIEINNQVDNLKISGFISKPNGARNDRSQQSFYVNKRWVKSDLLRDAIYDAYHSLIFVNKHPFLVLNIELNPQEIDVNVHPAKTEIKFEEQEKIKHFVTETIKERLKESNLIPEVKIKESQLILKPIKNNYTSDHSEQLVLKTEVANYVPCQKINNKFPPLRIIGQIHKTYFVAETTDGIILIDQHVVEERINYEKFMRELLNKHVHLQTLLNEEILEFTPQENMSIVENMDQLKLWGFDLELFGTNTYRVKTIPLIFNKLQPKELIYEIINNLNKNKLEEVQEEIITRMACRASIKGGDEMTIPQLTKKLSELEQCDFSYNCPHGRSIFIKIPLDEIEKKFNRR